MDQRSITKLVQEVPVPHRVMENSVAQTRKNFYFVFSFEAETAAKKSLAQPLYSASSSRSYP